MELNISNTAINNECGLIISDFGKKINRLDVSGN
jgi:hypothetical protein